MTMGEHLKGRGGGGRGQGRKCKQVRDRISVMINRDILSRLPCDYTRSNFINDAIMYYLQRPIPKSGKIIIQPDENGDIPRIVVPITDFEIVKKLNNDRKMVRIFFEDKVTHVFYLSQKQYVQLCQNYRKREDGEENIPIVICVFDGDRYIWSGLEYKDYSDRSYLERTFNAKSVDNIDIEVYTTVHIPTKITTIDVEPDSELVR